MKPDRVSLLVDLLQECNEERKTGETLPNEVFNALLKILPQVAVESAIVRRVDDGSNTGLIKAYLVQRPPDAPSHAGQWHSPGSFIRQGETVANVMCRISKRELKTAKIVHWHQERVQNNNLEPRGHTISLISSCAIVGEPTGGKWFALDQLPDQLVNHHHDLLWAAAQSLLTEPFLR